MAGTGVQACARGMAFHLPNIARDIEEDDRVGRCYLPVEWLVEMDIPPGQHMKPPFRQRLAVLARRLATKAAAFEQSARAGTPALPYRSAWAVLAAAGIYGEIGREVARRGEAAWDHRVTVSGRAKLGHIARAAWQAGRRDTLYAGLPRDARLWPPQVRTSPDRNAPGSPTPHHIVPHVSACDTVAHAHGVLPHAAYPLCAGHSSPLGGPAWGGR